MLLVSPDVGSVIREVLRAGLALLPNGLMMCIEQQSGLTWCQTLYSWHKMTAHLFQGAQLWSYHDRHTPLLADTLVRFVMLQTRGPCNASISSAAAETASTPRCVGSNAGIVFRQNVWASTNLYWKLLWIIEPRCKYKPNVARMVSWRRWVRIIVREWIEWIENI